MRFLKSPLIIFTLEGIILCNLMVTIGNLIVAFNLYKFFFSLGLLFLTLSIILPLATFFSFAGLVYGIFYFFKIGRTKELNVWDGLILITGPVVILILDLFFADKFEIKAILFMFVFRF